MPHKSKNRGMADWLWFFIAIPVSLVTVMLLRRRKAAPEPLHLVRRSARYIEPDSIPLDVDLVRERAAYTAMAEDEAAAGAEMMSEGGPVAPVESLDDLKVIEGIGPAIARLLRENGIRTFTALAEAPVERLKEILVSARLGHLADPTTWGEQARMAAAAEWTALEELQKTLKRGRRQ